MPITRATAPTCEPLTLAEVKAHLRVDISDDDALIGALISASRAAAENITRRSFCLQTWLMTLDSFPGPSLMGVPYGTAFSLPGHAILLERPPVLAITNIQYVAMDGTTQTMPTADYVDLTAGGTRRVDDICRITPVFGKIWPINLPQIGSVNVTYQTGYSSSSNTLTQQAAVPEDIRAWMKLRIGALYENREELIVGSRIVVAPMPMVDSMLDPHIVELM